MVLGGLWHGAAWTFVFWGALHGVLLIVNHLWRAVGVRLPASVGWVLTFMAVAVGWVFFRAETFDAAWAMVWTMFGGNGIGATVPPANFGGDRQLVALAFALIWVAAAPNTQQWVAGIHGKSVGMAQDTAPVRYAWAAGRAGAAALGVLGGVAIIRLFVGGIVNSFISSSDRLRTHGALALGVALAIGLGFAAATEALVRWRVEPVDLFARHVVFFGTADSADAVFGDSHMSLGFTGAEGFVNLAFPGENLATIAGKARLYYRHRAPGRVILQADPSMLSAVRDAEPATAYAPLIGETARRWVTSLSLRHRPRLMAYWQVFFERGGFAANRDIQADGAQTKTGRFDQMPQAERSAAALAEATHQRPPGDLGNSPELAALDQLAADLAARGAEVCLVTMPMAPEYREIADVMPEFALARHAFDDLADRHRVARVDLWSVAIDPAHVLNQDHLNHQGGGAIAPRIVSACFP